MVKLYKSIMALMLSIVAIAANAVSITINVDDPERVKVAHPQFLGGNYL